MKKPFWRYLYRQFSSKISAVPKRLADAWRSLPARLRRLGRHLRSGPAGRAWWVELALLLLDCLAAGEAYETLTDFVKFNTRPLTQRERALALPIFGPAIDYGRVRIDECSLVGPRQFHLCYVSCYLINSWGKMEDSLLVHELVHVWQYQQMGMVYMPRALAAQRTAEGYDYGGPSALFRARDQGRRLQDFNLEQQADIVADYYRLQQGRPIRWGRATYAQLPLYEYFVRQIR